MKRYLVDAQSQSQSQVINLFLELKHAKKWVDQFYGKTEHGGKVIKANIYEIDFLQLKKMN